MTVIVTDLDALALPRVQRSVAVTEAVSGGVVTLPEVPTACDWPAADIVQTVAFVLDHDSTDVPPDDTLVGLADSVTVTGTVVMAQACGAASSHSRPRNHQGAIFARKVISREVVRNARRAAQCRQRLPARAAQQMR